MEWFPRWPGLLLSPASSSSPRRHHLRGNGTSRGDIVKGSPSSSSPSTHSLGSSGEPPPPQPIRRRWLFVVMALSLVCFLSAVALFDLGRSPASPKVGVGSSGSGGNKTESANNADAAAPVTPASVLDLPYLVADKNNSLAKPEPSRPGWVRVVSAKAAHPAMYVPADGLIYCPIAKASFSSYSCLLLLVDVSVTTSLLQININSVFFVCSMRLRWMRCGDDYYSVQVQNILL